MNKSISKPMLGSLVALTALLASCGGSNDPVVAAPPPVVADLSCNSTASDGSSVVVGSGAAGDPSLPEPASGYRTGLKTVYSKTFMVSSSNPLASKAGCEILKAGGSAADAAVAVQAVLGLTVPEATGLGGGAFMLYYDATAKTVQAYDGRETAPAAATNDYLRYVSDTDRTTPVPSTRASGRSIGTIGVVRMLELAQQDHGVLAWKDLFGSASSLATNGFPIGGRLAAAISSNATNLKRDAEATEYFFNADGTPKVLGTVLKNPKYAATLSALAAQGANAIYTGPIAQDIVAKIGATTQANGSAMTPGLTTMADMAAYQAKRREPVCVTYRAYWVCSMSPPSSGGIGVASAMGILENFNMSLYKPAGTDEGGIPTSKGVHLVTEAERLAYADRDMYVADTDFVPLPGGTWDTMLNKRYMSSRASLINFSTSMRTATAGALGAVPQGVDTTVEHGTNHFTIVDKQGNVVSMTTTVESSMGSFHMTNGFILNNQLTDFSANPIDTTTGLLVANRVSPGKRPRSTMAPTMVFKIAADGGKGDFVMATGSPGGGTIIQYVVKTLVGALDWGLDAQQSASLVDFGASNSPTTTIGGEHPYFVNGQLATLMSELTTMGHTISNGAQTSGVGNIVRTTANNTPIWSGGTDPRREGVVLGDTFTP
ncbi:gamma-glutamyltransferase family protein [Xylophilus sp. GOD-11R]|uniref:gamma-glutamyltransferase family protein n=1 Tax=Xylophilus sp. GOD-11R TaxID=3089814 RepID=UPI00298BCA58|nr:gamma-glutamyltransferase family protein [Xylophilus sp. GOD-11R]WPB57189.1 gamma-glutamyltransferase family protein [Xylophilus sp. GOD-11R]